MKANTLKSLLGILILGSMFNLSCNQNSPAPITPSAPNAPTSTTTNTNTPEGLAIDIQGHWYLDSSINYISPTNYNVTRYGFNATFLNSSSIVTHYEVNITNVITYTQTTQALATQSNIRITDNINWFRNISNDTTSYTSTAGSCITSIVNNNLFVSATGYMNNYLRSYTGSKMVIADNLSSIKSGSYWYWHR